MRAKAIAGTSHGPLALGCPDPRRQEGLLGFAFQRAVDGDATKWLTWLKVFKSVVPNPQVRATYPSNELPI